MDRAQLTMAMVVRLAGDGQGILNHCFHVIRANWHKGPESLIDPWVIQRFAGA
jgi:hypothetical protein